MIGPVSCPLVARNPTCPSNESHAGELPEYGAVGSYGLRGAGLDMVDGEIQAADHDCGFQADKIYNLESSRII